MIRNVICMSVLLCTIAAALTSFGMVPERVHAAATEEQSEYAELDRYIESAMKKYNIPGAALGVVEKDSPLYIKGYGSADSKHTAITPQTPFILGSTSKSMTALAVMQLVDEGKVELDAPVQRYLPDFSVSDPNDSAAITVRHLLNQTSGIPKSAGLLLPSRKITLEQYPATQKATKLTEPVGSAFQYSNVNYDVLGALVQAVSGEPYGDYMKNHIFDPLEMEHTYVSKAAAAKAGLSDGYQPLFGWMVATNPKERPANVPSGYIKSSAEDMAHYLMAQMNKGAYAGKKLVTDQSAALMHGEQGALVDEDVFYGMGWIKQGNTIMHDGTAENFQSNLWIDGNTGIVLLLNSNDTFIPASAILMEGVQHILKGQAPSDEDPPIKAINWTIRILAVLILLFIIRSVYILLAWSRVYKPKRMSITLHFISIGLFHSILPIALILLPALTNSSWKLLFAFVPGMTHLMFVASIVLLACGTARLVLLFRSLSLRTHSLYS
ncbi:serine hydrolase domain-containing protein [Paenibacillus sp. PL91]|uniref:serine hydrolase domain-containing protein n=1 Tax=Paenibacillus sp. PL91 TaxID=2729538 RepID=UPI00145C8E78|nr:serine hydrolase domain-containing protein [Paenibacillus sp. PL91]MBC9198339.1 beta-lactamase family protein [Paenibacillus sp. PL91]